MKTLIAVASVAAVLAVPALAQAQMSMPTPSFYGNLGYTGFDLNHVDLSAIQGRLGARFGQYFGVEGEVAAGIASDHYAVAGVRDRVKLNNQEALYGVGFWPVSPKFDLLARVGYGGETFKNTVLGVSGTDSQNSWNYGVGAQYHLDGVNGVRVDYTREDFQGDSHSADVWSVAYSRKF
jgi:outer membrane immunogenic protein